jgi:ribosomal protein S27AE
MMQWFSPRKIGQIKLVAKFQEQRSEKPQTANHGLVSQQSKGYRESNNYDDRNPLACPNCKTTVYMKHGDRILCTCGVYIETYGNSLDWWEADVETTKIEFTSNPRLNPGDLALSIYEQLTVSDRIKEIADDYPAVREALQEVETLIKLHESIDKTE